MLFFIIKISGAISLVIIVLIWLFVFWRVLCFVYLIKYWRSMELHKNMIFVLLNIHLIRIFLFFYFYGFCFCELVFVFIYSGIDLFHEWCGFGYCLDGIYSCIFFLFYYLLYVLFWCFVVLVSRFVELN